MWTGWKSQDMDATHNTAIHSSIVWTVTTLTILQPMYFTV